MAELSFDNPVFRVYVIAAALMVLKMIGTAWLTVYRMMKVDAGYRSPEDERRGALNKSPRAGQLDKNEYVERIRRIHQNDGENVPLFLVIGLVFVLVDPGLTLAMCMLYGYAASRFLHFAAYLTAHSHELRATCWTIGSLLLLGMTGAVLVKALA